MEQLCTVSFNPCFIGTYSFTPINLYKPTREQNVLILVLLELILLLVKSTLLYSSILRFNPCFIGTYSFTI